MADTTINNTSIKKLPNSISGDGSTFVAKLKNALNDFSTDVTKAIDEGATKPLQCNTITLSEQHSTDSLGYPQNDIYVSWLTTGIDNYKGAQIWYRKGNSGSFTYAGISNVTSYTLQGVEGANTYYIKVVTIGDNEATADFDAAPTESILIVGEVITPSLPDQFTVTWVGGKPEWKWTSVNNQDYFDYYELREDTNTGQYTGLLDATQGLSSDVEPSNRAGNVYLYVRNIFGTYSLPFTKQYSNPTPAKPTAPTSEQLLLGISVTGDLIPTDSSGIEWNFTDNATQEVQSYTSSINTFSFYAASGTFIIKYRFYDSMGSGEWSDTITVTIKSQIDSSLIASDAVTEDKIVANAITETKIADNAVTSGKITANAIVSDKIAANAVTSEKIIADAIIAEKIAANAVVSEKINAGAVTTNKIDANAITADKIKANAVTAEKIKANAITADKIKANAITADKVLAGAITAEKIASKSISTEKFATQDIDMTGSLAIVGGSVRLSEDGLRLTGGDNSYTLFNKNGINYYDENGVVYAQVKKMIIGTASDGQYVRFAAPWSKPPNVMLSPSSLKVNDVNFPSANILLVCEASEISSEGFRINCYTALAGGSYGSLAPNISDTMGIGNPNMISAQNQPYNGNGYKNIWYIQGYKDFSVGGIPSNAQYVSLNYSWSGGCGMKTFGNPPSNVPSQFVEIQLLNGAGVMQSAQRYTCGYNGANDIPFYKNSTISGATGGYTSCIMRVWFAYCIKTSDDKTESEILSRLNSNDLKFVRGGVIHNGTITIPSGTYSTTGNTKISQGSATFTVTDGSTNVYTIE